MRWILVFVILYLIPLIVLFKNYKKFTRACIYASTYVVLATTLVISNIYISGLKKIEPRTNYTAIMSSKDLSVSTFDSNKEDDITKIKHFKTDIRDIEDIALNPINECIKCSNDVKVNLNKLQEAQKSAQKAMYMCERVVEIYEEMEVPELSKDEYTKVLEECVVCMKEAYEMKYKAIEEINIILEQKNISRIHNVEEYVKESEQNINNYKNKISCLEKDIQGK